MTNRNMSLKCEPFLLKPVGKDYLWGGSRLKDDFSKDLDLTPLAETWECSTHPDGLSVIASGSFQGCTLAEVLKQYPEMLGSHSEALGELPILIKFIDARRDLSVQVHPTDAYAQVHENGQRGKTEMWYVVDAARDAKIVCGFRNAITAEQLRESAEDGSIEKYLQKVPARKNDLFFIEAGTVHAIGAGMLVAEIQESSNLTYRLYDYNRVDKNGKARELHIEKAVAAAKLTASREPRQPMRVMRYRNGSASEFLCRCRYFQVERVLINTERIRSFAAFRTDSSSFQVLLCVGGCGLLTDKGAVNLCFFKGDCIFLPADSGPFYLHGCAQFLRVRC